MGKGLEWPDSGSTVERDWHEKIWEVFHRAHVRTVFRMAGICMYKLLLLFYATWLDVLIDVDVAFICRDEEVSIFNKNEHVENLLAEVHDVPEKRDQIACLVLFHDFLLFNKFLYQLVTFKFVSVAR